MIDNPQPGDRVALRFYTQDLGYEWVEGEIMELRSSPNINRSGAMVRITRGDTFIYLCNLFTIDEGLRLALEDAAK